MEVHACEANAYEGGKGESGAEGHPWLQSESEASLGYWSACLDQQQMSHVLSVILNSDLYVSSHCGFPRAGAHVGDNGAVQ